MIRGQSCEEMWQECSVQKEQQPEWRMVCMYSQNIMLIWAVGATWTESGR